MLGFRNVKSTIPTSASIEQDRANSRDKIPRQATLGKGSDVGVTTPLNPTPPGHEAVDREVDGNLICNIFTLTECRIGSQSGVPPGWSPSAAAAEGRLLNHTLAQLVFGRCFAAIPCVPLRVRPVNLHHH